MKKIDVGQTISILANLGVVAGIIFLAIEVRQNQALMQREFDLQIVDGLKLIAESVDDLRTLRIQSEEITQLWLDGAEGRDLDANSAQRFSDMCGMHVWNSAVLYERNRVLGEAGITQAMVTELRNERETWPGMKACWESQEDALRVWGLADLVDAASDLEIR